jgi:uncharacterized membrane-anchored protein
MDGFEVLRSDVLRCLRDHVDGACRGIDRIVGLSVGADDYRQAVLAARAVPR